MPTLKNSIADLRSKYSRYLKISLILSLSFLILAFQFSPYPDPSSNELEEPSFAESEWNEDDVVKDPPLPPPTPEIPKETVIFKWSEVMPEPIGGLATIQNKVQYTEIAKRIGLEGTVYIEAIVDSIVDKNNNDRTISKEARNDK